MGSGAETVEETVGAPGGPRARRSACSRSASTARSPSSTSSRALPATVKTIAVLDRTKEPGGVGEPLYLDVVAALQRGGGGGGARMPRVIGGRYGLAPRSSRRRWSRASSTSWRRSGRENHFTVGIHDDVTHTEPRLRPDFTTEDPATVRAVFYGLGADGTVGANKNSIKIIGEETDNYAQGYFVYDSKKSGSVTDLPPALRAPADPLQRISSAGRPSSPATSSRSWSASTC